MTATETFLTRTAIEWTAIGTVTLSVVTVVYVVITGRIAGSAARSAASAQAAAEAAARSARIAEAGLHVDFAVTYDRESSLGNRWIRVEASGANVFFNGGGVDIAAIHVVGKDAPEFVLGELIIDDPPDEPPFLLHRGEKVQLRWEFPDVDPARPATGDLLIQYSLDEVETPKEIRRSIDFGTPKE